MSEQMTIVGARLSVRAVTLDQKSLTIAVYEQLPMEDFDEETVWNKIRPLWRIDRCRKRCATDDRGEREAYEADRSYWRNSNPCDYRFGLHVHVLSATLTGEPVLIRVHRKELLWRELDEGDELRTAHRAFLAAPQAYIGVGR